eukprot:967216-Amphidinium_carterae.2
MAMVSEQSDNPQATVGSATARAGLAGSVQFGSAEATAYWGIQTPIVGNPCLLCGIRTCAGGAEHMPWVHLADKTHYWTRLGGSTTL